MCCSPTEQVKCLQCRGDNKVVVDYDDDLFIEFIDGKHALYCINLKKACKGSDIGLLEVNIVELTCFSLLPQIT